PTNADAIGRIPVTPAEAMRRAMASSPVSNTPASRSTVQAAMQARSSVYAPKPLAAGNGRIPVNLVHPVRPLAATRQAMPPGSSVQLRLIYPRSLPAFHSETRTEDQLHDTFVRIIRDDLPAAQQIDAAIEAGETADAVRL